MYIIKNLLAYAFLLVNSVYSFSIIPKSNHIFIKYTNHKVEHKLNTIIIPGFLIEPIEYKDIAYDLQIKLLQYNINTDVFILKLLGNVAHNLQVDSAINSIIKDYKINPNSLCIIGHSQGAYNGIDISNKYKAPLIQLAGTFNSNLIFPYPIKELNTFEQPLLVLLNENDEYLSCTDAIKDMKSLVNNNPRNQFISINENMKHSDGITNDITIYKNKKLYSSIISKKIAEFINYFLNNSVESEKFLVNEINLISAKYSIYLYESDPLSNANCDWTVKVQEFINKPELNTTNNYNLICNDNSHPNNMFLSILYIVTPYFKYLIDFHILFSRFLFENNNELNNNNTLTTQVYSSLKNPMCVSNNHITETPNLIKFNILSSNAITVSAQDINNNTFVEAYNSLETDDKYKYKNYGNKIIFNKDIIIPDIVGGYLLWLLTPLNIKNDENNNLIIRSPVLIKSNKCYMKLISNKQVLEWILNKSYCKK